MDMLKKYDPSFIESEFITNIDNIFIQLHLGIMMNDLEKYRHFVSEEVYKQFENKLKLLNDNNQIQMYDEINVKQTIINSVDETDDSFIINVTIISRYMDYVIDKETKRKLFGDNTRRIEKENYLIFKKNKDVKNQGEARKCQSCGANIDVNNNGICPYCGTVYNLSKYDWILTSIETR